MNAGTTLSKVQLSNSGTINYSAPFGNGITFVNGGNVSNNSGASFNLTSGGAMDTDGTGDFVNFGGTFSKNSGAVQPINVRFDNTSGTVAFGGTGKVAQVFIRSS